jgi:lipopolysaccharide transport system ATP-binding protein
MSPPVIKVEGLGKQYVIGSRENGRETFREMLAATAAAPFRRLQKLRDKATPEERIWVLKDVKFEVNKGEVVGIIGRNGAGKSTLLKILSRITNPTEGRAEIRGRVASLLDVGTGFHPELTGRENIYLNGAILGMSRAEIARKLDAIIAFAEIDKFLDTPVKRYSSGMYVRLAFAVAAHLEPEILIVDEVLAVGDIEFQRKCLGKMGEVAGGGRTVLFVSHNMTAVQNLCSKVILIANGRASAIGPSSEIVARYLASNTGLCVADGDLRTLRRKGEGQIRFHRLEFFDQNGLPVTTPRTGDELNVVLSFDGSRTEPRPVRVGITFYDVLDNPLFICANEASCNELLRIGAGQKVACRIPRLPLSAGRYKVGLFLERAGVIQDWLQDYVPLEVADKSFFGTGHNIPLKWQGKMVLVDNEWRRLSDVADADALVAQQDQCMQMR